MPQAPANGITIEYERMGKRTDPPVLLIMGLGAQLISWDDAFCKRLAGAGFQVVRYDNRDSGLSTHLDELGAPDLLAALARTEAPPYDLEALADDAAALLRFLNLPATHIVGISMGGMVAQLVAIRHPRRVLSLTTMMSDTGGESRELAEPEVFAELLAAPLADELEGAIEQSVRLHRLLSGGGEFDEAAARRRAGRQIRRCYYPMGVLRQAAAVLAARDRTAQLAALRVPTLVIHGTRDPLVPFENGVRVHRAIPRSKMLTLDGVGHDLPEAAAERALDALVGHLTGAGGRRKQ
ncbi:MAG TPA: alpha/beta hydrolase [Candidatus Dormibacteraeota bacterium]